MRFCQCFVLDYGYYVLSISGNNVAVFCVALYPVPITHYPSTMTIDGWLRETTDKFTASSIDSARLDALLLLEHVLQTTRATLLAHPEMALPATTLVKLDSTREQRLGGIPIAYIVNKKEFYGRDYLVNEHVLIPRPETENMIDMVKALNYEAPRVADIGTGSGCIAITLALEIPHSKVTATDVSKDALKIAELNAKTLGARVTFTISDLFTGFSGKKFDIICANLPYVPDGIITSTEITKEPATALFSGSDGLDHYRGLFRGVNALLHKPTYVLTESLESQHGEIEVLANNAGYGLTKTSILVQLYTLS